VSSEMFFSLPREMLASAGHIAKDFQFEILNLFIMFSFPYIIVTIKTDRKNYFKLF